MTTLLTYRCQHVIDLPLALLVCGLPVAAVVNTGGATPESGPVNAGAGSEEIRPMGQAESPPQGMKFVQLVVMPLLLCVLLVALLRRYVLH